MSDLLRAISAQMSSVVGDVRKSLVQLSNGRSEDGRSGSGAGTIWHPEGLILTNAHVVQGRAPQVTLWDGRTFPSQLLVHDDKLDLAALAINATDLPTIELGKSGELAAGQWVLALGHPWGVTGAASAGAVIAVGKPPELPWYPGDLIQVSLQLRPGHSGGPLVDGKGRILGINTMIAGPQVGLAIPLHTVKRFLRDRLGKANAVVI
jgi:serine protease Do